MHRTTSAILLLLLAVTASADDKPTPAQQYKALVKEYHDLGDALSKPTAEAERMKLLARWRELPARFLELAERHPKDPAAVEALIQTVLLANASAFPDVNKDSPGIRALAILQRDHARSDKVGVACQAVAFAFHKSHEAFLRAVADKNTHKDVLGVAVLSLAQFLNDRADRLAQLDAQDGPELLRRYHDTFGKDFVEELRRQDRAKAAREIESLFDRAAEKYPDVKIPEIPNFVGSGGTVGEKAKAELYQIRTLAVGKAAPEIEGEDQDGKRFKLSDYRGKVVLLDFWYHL